jgi:hypothetical protein
MPLNGLIGYVGGILTAIATWFQTPYDERVKKDVQKRLWAYFWYVSSFYFFVMPQYDVLTMIFTKVQPELQWLFSFLLPRMREINIRLLNKILGNAFDSFEWTTTIGYNGRHAMYVAVALGTTATEMSTYCLLAVDFSFNLWNTIKIIKLSTKIHTKESNKTQTLGKLKSELLNLTIVEIIETLVPIAYISTILLAYYGPNANLLGTIGGGHWQNIKIENIRLVVVSTLALFFIDLSSAVIGGILLWKFCSIDFVREIYATMKCYWHLIALSIVSAINGVRISSLCK